MKKKVKLIGGIILAIAVVAGVAASALAPLAVETKTLVETTAKATFTEQGSYVYNRSLAVYPQVSGEVMEVRVKTGSKVKKGDILAVISASDYERQIKSLESNIAGLEAQIQNLSVQEQQTKSALRQTRESLIGQLAQAEAGIRDFDTERLSLDKQIELQREIVVQYTSIANIARNDYKWAREEYENSGYLEEPEFNAYRSAYYQAQAAADASRQQLLLLEAGTADKESFQAQKASIEAQIAIVDQQLAQGTAWAMQKYYQALIESTKQDIESMTEKLGKANVTAPVDGVVEDLPVSNTNLITQQTAVAMIGSEPVVEVFVPIREIDGVHTGDTVELIVDKRLGSESVSGTVTIIEDEAQVKVSALGVEERKVRVLIKPDGNALGIGYGMDVRFTVFQQENTVIVPKTAVFEKDGADFVWAVEDGTARLREVVKGVETRDGYAISTGLSSGDTIILDANTEGLSEGKRIK